MDGDISNDIIDYHRRTRHGVDGYARSPGTMDWANQPVPFRTYDGGRVQQLKLLHLDPAVGHDAMYTRAGTGGPSAVSVDAVAGFLELSMGLSAWKGAGQSRWALRINPSSGNLHPTETYLVMPEAPGLPAGVYHYDPLGHRLVQRSPVPERLWARLQTRFGPEGFFVGLSSIFWRESWKYGERAFRYCNLDAGHALAALSFSAGLFGWRVTYLNGMSDRHIETILGFDQTQWHPLEEEHPEMLCYVHDAARTDVPRSIPPDVVEGFAQLRFEGKPERLSKAPVNWEAIRLAAEGSRKPETPEERYRFDEPTGRAVQPSPLTAPQIIRRRRSGTAYDPESAMERPAFMAMLDRTLPRNGWAPFDAQLAEPRVHLLIFVHNVKEMPQGLYFFCRRRQDIEEIRGLGSKAFFWEAAAEPLPLFRLAVGDFRYRAMEVSCNQEIAGFSAFSLGMMARFRPIVSEGPYRYRQLLWECGMIGQVLYLEAEAQGVRGTGIGCFFDDAVHRLMGLPDDTYQSLYHFTVGMPEEDPRLRSYPPYAHLKGGQPVG